ncbi:MAG: aminodeoxychorismate/anthranilate synthase component II [Pirellulales bacterium]|nr:aminodeoxychorismate/anthranilate synthase component II [Pirellulales bacterium]
MLLIIDNYDSFVHNLARHFERLRQRTLVVRNDAIDVAAVRRLAPAAIILSPGPCAPDQAGIGLQLVRALHREIPMLGVCLGHQTIAQALGGRIVRATEPMHGRDSLVRHDGECVFRGLPSPFRAGRYHSLVVDPASLPECLHVTAQADGGAIMGIAHRALPIVGVQFHPESILTEHGYELLANFLRLARLAPPAESPRGERRDIEPAAWTAPQHSHALTF